MLLQVHRWGGTGSRGVHDRPRSPRLPCACRTAADRTADEGPSFDAYEVMTWLPCCCAQERIRPDGLRRKEQGEREGAEKQDGNEARAGGGERRIVPGQFDDAEEKSRNLINELLDDIGEGESEVPESL
eukprot:755570-Hanusia_phi.AAC.4